MSPRKKRDVVAEFDAANVKKDAEYYLNNLMVYDVGTDSMVRLSPRRLDSLQSAEAWMVKFIRAARGTGPDSMQGVLNQYELWRAENFGSKGHFHDGPFPLTPVPSALP